MKSISSEKIDSWIDSINKYQTMPDDLSQDKSVEATYMASGAFVEIFNLMAKEGRFKDKFDTSKMYLNPFGLNIIIKSEKLGIQFLFGIDHRGIVLSSPLDNFNNLRHMKDEFYLDFLSLRSLGKIEVNQMEKGDKKYHPELYNNNKSLIYRILRHYVTDMMAEHEYMEFGDIEISWKAEVDFNEILYKATEAFKILYSLNYQLWKISDLKNK